MFFCSQNITFTEQVDSMFCVGALQEAYQRTDHEFWLARLTEPQARQGQLCLNSCMLQGSSGTIRNMVL